MSLRRDALGRVVEATDAAGRVTGTGFDAAGRMVSERHADGTSTEFGYSPDGYLIETQYTDQTVTYAVDAVGNRTTMTDAMGTSAWEFDWANRVVSDTDAHGVTQVFGYDAVGNQVRAGFADGRVLTRTFDGRGLAVSQSGPDGVTEFAYDAEGNLTQTTRPSGVVTSTQFDLVGRATSIVHAGGTPEGFDGDVSPGSGAPGNAFGHCNGAPGHVNQEPTGCWSGELVFGYDYDARGLVVQRTVTTDEGATVTDYTHDALGRLTESVTGDYTATYGWDAGSNLVAESVSDDVATNLAGDGWVIDRDVNQVNQVTSVVTDGRLPAVHTTTESFTYDARGNRTGSVTTRTTGNKTHEVARVDYTFDGMDQLVGVLDFGDNLNNVKDDLVTGWSRDGLGRGLSVSVNGARRDRVFDGTALIVDGDTRVTFGPDGRVLSEAFETVEGNGKNAHTITVSRDVLTDLLGSAVGIAEDGIVDADLAWFGDFGDTLSKPEWDTVTSFTGHVETAGLTEFATRSFDPASRVWVQEDSFTGTVTRASSLNRYAYVEGSPVSHADVLGAFRAAAAMAAQQLSAADYAAFMAELTELAVAPATPGEPDIGGLAEALFPYVQGAVDGFEYVRDLADELVEIASIATELSARLRRGESVGSWLRNFRLDRNPLLHYMAEWGRNPVVRTIKQLEGAEFDFMYLLVDAVGLYIHEYDRVPDEFRRWDYAAVNATINAGVGAGWDTATDPLKAIVCGGSLGSACPAAIVVQGLTGWGIENGASASFQSGVACYEFGEGCPALPQPTKFNAKDPEGNPF